jgi:hypothetical protein
MSTGVCACPVGSVEESGKCVIKCPATFTLNASTGVCECPAETVEKDGVCECPSGYVEDAIIGSCVCPVGQVETTDNGCINVCAATYI